MYSAILACLAGVFILAHGIDYLLALRDDPREPRRAPTWLPLVGHLWGFLCNGPAYYNNVSRNTKEPIWTVTLLPGQKIYLTHDARLLSMIRKSKVVNNKQLLRGTNKIHSAVSSEGYDQFDGDVLDDFKARTRDAFALGPKSDSFNLRMARQSVVEVAGTVEQQGPIELLQWTKHVVLQVVSAGFYGMRHPFASTEMEGAMWDWDKSRPWLHINIDFGSKGSSARDKVLAALGEYYQNTPDDISAVARQRYNALRDGGVNEDDAVRVLAFLNDGNFNIVPLLYWAIFDIYSRPELLEDLRKEVRDRALHKSAAGGFELNISELTTHCPLLSASVQESHRTRHLLYMSRQVTEDTLLDGRYMLKKGSLVYLPSQCIHTNPEIWGPDVLEFNPYRFMPSETRSKIPVGSFLPWGLAPCPARHFISTSIMVLTALMISRVDLVPAKGSSWAKPPRTRKFEIATVPTAREDFYVSATSREEGAGEYTVVTRAKSDEGD